MTTANLPRKVTLDGVNLFALAAELYGDATLANVLAQANGLTDPFPPGIITLSVPLPGGGQSGGLPNP